VRPIVFEQTVGWLHPASGGRGVVIAGAHGFEDLCSRRFLTMMARRIAAAGMPVLQFDYPGCGDAANDHTLPDSVAAWTTSIASAIDRLKAETGVADVLVIGFRLGALLAPAAIAGRDDVAGLALLAPPISGKAYAREMVGLSRMVDAMLPPAADGGKPFDGIEAAGFRISAETAADLRALEWRDRPAMSPDLDLLLMPAGAAHSDLAGRIATAGGNVQVETFGGFSRLMSNPTSSDIPQSTLQTVVDWATKNSRPGAGQREPVIAKPTTPRGMKLESAILDGKIQGRAILEGDGFRELPLVLDPAPEICGVLCLPASAPVTTEAVLILNAGAIPHVGWARGAVDMARTLARQGIASMRVDLPGLGQSEAAPEKRLFLYDEKGRGDVIRIVDWLERYGFGQVCAAGICAGAYQAFHAARYDVRITHLAMVNPLCFSWNSSYALDMGLSKIRHNANSSRALREGLGSGDETDGEEPDARRPVLTSAVSNLGRRALRLSLELSKSAFSNAWWKRALPNRSVERWMRKLTERGTHVLIVNCEGDLSIGEVARHFGPGGERLKRMPGVTTALVFGADHTLTPAPARAELTARIVRMLSSVTSER
jgi:alpha-beta hydrolase superfamily lysophospholipase